jgi:ubiquinone/menaquinone biosynthesis C-methylase UbiE
MKSTPVNQSVEAQAFQHDQLDEDYHDQYDGERPYEECWRDYFCEYYTADLIRAIWGQSPPYRLLDCGSACGLTLAAFSKLGIEAWGIENSEYIHARTPRRWRKRNLLGDVRSLPFPDNHFDFVYDTTLCYVPESDIDQAVSELFRVCKFGLFHGTLTSEMTLGGTEADEIDEVFRTLYSLGQWHDIFVRNGFRIAIENARTLAQVWQIEIDACAKAEQEPWYPNAETMRYCFYSKNHASGLAPGKKGKSKLNGRHRKG